MFKDHKIFLVLVLLFIFLIAGAFSVWYFLIKENKSVEEVKIEEPENYIIKELNRPFIGNSTATPEQIIKELNRPVNVKSNKSNDEIINDLNKPLN